MKTFLSLFLLCAPILLASCEKNNPVVQVTDIVLNKTALSLVEGSTERLLATVAPDNADNKAVVWSSGNPSVATVSAAGEVTAVKEGLATIVANAGNQSSMCEIAVTPREAKIGHFFYSDQTLSTNYNAGKTCIGIVFWVDPSDAAKGKIVSLDEGNETWGPKGTDTSADDESDGARNMATIKTLDITYHAYPAFAWCDQKNANGQSGWYLPAKTELSQLCTAKNIVIASLSKVPSAVRLSSAPYWSSTEYVNSYAYYNDLSLADMRAFAIKDSKRNVRAVAVFNTTDK